MDGGEGLVLGGTGGNSGGEVPGLLLEFLRQPFISSTILQPVFSN